jgi:hypothetical protein
MASGKSPTQRLPDAVREAVERTVEATRESVKTTRESAQDTRGRAQEALDDLVRGAEAGAETVRDRVRGAIADVRPATSDDIRDLKAELRAIGRRLDAIEEALPAKRGGGGAKRSGSAKSRGSGSGKARGGSAKRGSRSRS